MIMATNRKHSVEMLDPAVLYLRILVDDGERIFVLNGDDERVVAVGSASSADIQLERPGISPIHFYFERIEYGIWIVPAYCVSELRVNTARASSPSQLGHRSIVEFGNTRIVAENSFLPYKHLGSPPKPHGDDKAAIRRSYLAQLPGEDEPTHQPWVLPDEDEPTQQPWMGNERARDACLETSTILMAPKRTSRISTANPAWISEEHEDSSAALAKTLVAHPKSSAATKGHDLMQPEGQLCTPTATSPTTPTNIVNVAPLSKTLLGIAPLILGVNESIHDTRCTEGQGARNVGASSSPSQVPTVFDGVPVPNLDPKKRSWLTKLGLLTKQYPVRVCLAAISIALAGSGTVVFTTKMLLFKAPGPAIGTPSANVPQSPKDIRKPPPPPADLPQLQSIVIISPGPPQVGRAQDSSAKSGSAEFGGAALSLVQGHYADAQAAYASLAARSPADQTYLAISQLLARRLSPTCANGASSRPTSCPEIRP